MSDDDIERFEEERELELYREYRDVLPMFSYVVETERRFYLANEVKVVPQQENAGWVEVQLEDAWVWDMFRPGVERPGPHAPRRQRRGAVPPG
jgi:hypothetical protein